MAYVTVSDILSEIPRLPNTTTASGYSDIVALINHQITTSEGIVNGMLSSQYSIPFDTTPPIIRSIVIDFVAFRVFRSLYSRDNKTRNDYIDDYDKSNIFLKKISMGEMRISDTAGNIIPFRNESKKIRANTLNYQPIFDLDTITSSRVDPEYLSGIDRL